MAIYNAKTSINYAKESVRVNSYMKNLAKSAGYISMDIFKSYAPTMSSLASSTKEAASNGYQAIKDFTSSSNDSDFSFKGIKNKSGEVINNMWKNTVEDLKSGKIYNKERNDALGDEIARGFLGEDFNFDFDFDDDWGDDESSSSEESTAKAVVAGEMQSTKAIVTAVDAMGKGISASMTNATVESASYIAASARENSLALFNLNKEGFGAITQALMSVNETIYGFSKIGAPLTAHMQNSSLFYAKTGESLNNIEQTLKQIEQNTKPAPVTGSKGYKSKRSLGSMMSDEGVNWSELVDSMKETVNEYKDLTSMFVDMFRPTAKSGGKNISILGMGATALAKKLIPKAFEDALKGLDESIKYGLGAGLTKMSKKRTGNFLVDTLLDMFMPQRDLKSSISTSNYEKGAVQWDGVARKALTDVIPTTLLQIYSVLSGTDPMRFDYDKGKFVKADSISAAFKNRKSKYVKESGGDFYTEVEKAIKGSGKSDKDQAKMLADAYKFFEYAFDNTDHNIRNTSGIDPATFAMIQAVAANMKDKKFKNKWAVESNKKAADWSNSNRSEEASGFSMMQMLHNEFSGEGGKGKKGTRTTIIGLDEYGHNYYFYLQGIWQYVGYMANNWGGKGKGKKGKGAPPLNASTLPPIQSVDLSSGEQTTQEANESLGLSNTTEEADDAQNVKDNTSKIKKWLKENVSDKMRNKINKIFGTELTEGQFGAVGIMNSVSNAINDLIWGGDDENPEKGLFSYLFDKTKKLFDNLTDYFKKNVIDKFKDWFKEKVGDKWKDSEWVKGTKETLGKVGKSIKGSVRKVFIGNDGTDNGSAAYGRKVTKTGTVTVSEGELIIPSEYNPYYHGATNKASQINNEKRASGGRYAMYAPGGTVGENPGEYGFTTRDATDAEDFSAKHGIGTKSIFGLLIQAASGAFAKVKHTLDDSVDEKKLEEDKKKLSNGIGKALQEVGGAKGEIGAGAVLGVGASILTGAIIGPIAGAALGAGIGFISKSKAAQDLLFGEEEIDEDGVKKRKHQKLYDFFMKELPGVGKGAAIGGAAGLFLGSPLLGAFLGAAGGFMTSSESFKKWLFGEKDMDDGAIPKDVQEYVKKKLPAVTAGAVLGAVAGPFGIVGNILLGSSLGIAATSGRLHDSIFGGNGVEKEKSLVFVVKEKIFGGIDNIFHNMNNRFKIWGKELAKSINDKLSKAIDNLKENAKAGKGGFLTKLVGGTINAADWVIDKTVKAPFKLAGGLTSFIDNRIATGNLKKGYSTYNRKAKRNMTADERMSARTSRNAELLDKNFGKFDKFLSSIESFDEINLYKRIFDTIKTEPVGSEDYNKAIEFLTKDKKFKQFMNFEKDKNLEKFIKKNAIKITSLISDEANREDAAGNKVFTAENQAKLREEKKVNLIQTITDYLKTVTTYGVKIIQEDNKDPNAPDTPLLPDPKDSETENKYTSGGLSGEPLKLVKNNQGEEVVDNKDKENRKIMAKNNAAMAGLASLSTLGDKLGGILGKLFGKKDEKKEKKSTLWDKIMSIKDWISDKLAGAKNFLDGKLGGIISSLGTFVPAIGTVTSAIGEFFNVTTVSGFLKQLAGDAVAFLALKELLFGKQDSTFNKAINYLAKQFDLGGSPSENSEEGNGKPNDNGGQKHDFQTDNGIPVTTSGDGTYTDNEGNVYDGSQVNTVIAGADTFVGNLRKRTLERVITGRQTLVGAIANKTTWGKKIGGLGKKIWGDAISQGAFDQGVAQADDIAKGMKAGNLIGNTDDIINGVRTAAANSGNADEYAKGFKATINKLSGKSAKAVEGVVEDASGNIIGAASAEVDDVVKGALQTNIDDFLEKIAKWAPKLPFVGEKIAPAVANSMDDLSKAIATNIGKVASKAANVISTAVPYLLIGLIIKDFITGWEDARTILGITKTPTTPQRAICGLLRAVKNNIPYVGIIGSLIPDSFLINLFAKHIAPVFGIDTSQLLKDQDEAQEQVEAYNKEHGTNYNVAEYNKAVLHDYTFTERISNAAKTTIQQTKDNWKSIKGAFEEEGGGLKGFTAAVKTAFAKGLPGIFGDISEAKRRIYDDALKGDIEDIWSVELKGFGGESETNAEGIETAVPSIFSRMVGQIPIFVSKVTATPIALVAKAFNSIKDTFTGSPTEILGNIKENLSNANETLGVTNALKAIKDGSLSDLWSYNGADKNENGFIKVLKFVPTVPIKLIATPFALVSKAGHAIWDNLIHPLFEKYKAFSNYCKELGGDNNAKQCIIDGDITSLWTYNSADEDDNGFFKVLKFIPTIPTKLIATPFALISKAGHAIWDNIVNPIVNKVKETGSNIKQGFIDGFRSAMTGEQLEYIKDVEDDEGNPLSGFQRVVMAVGRISGAVFGLFNKAGKAIKSIVTDIFTTAKNSVVTYGKTAIKLSKYALTGDPKSLWTQDKIEADPENPTGMFTSIMLDIQRVTLTPISALTWLGKKVIEGAKTIFTSAKNSVVTYGKTAIKLSKYALTGDPKSLWTQDKIEADPENPTGMFTSIMLGIEKITLTPISALTWLGKKVIVEPISNLIKLAKATTESLTQRSGQLMGYVTSGDVDGLLSDTATDDEGNPVSGFLKGIDIASKIILYIPTQFTRFGNFIKEKFNNIKDSIISGFNTVSEAYVQVAEYANQGDIKGMLNAEVEFTESPVSAVAKGITIGAKIVNFIPAVVKFVGNKIHDGFEAIKKPVVEGLQCYIDAQEEIRGYQSKGDIGGIWDYQPEFPDSPLGKVFSAVTVATKVFGTIGAIPVIVGEKISGFFGKIKDQISDNKSKLDTFSENIDKAKDDGDIDAILAEKYEGSGVVGNVFKFASLFIKVGGVIGGVIKLIGNKIFGLAEDAKDYIKDKWEDSWLYDVYKGAKEKGQQLGLIEADEPAAEGSGLAVNPSRSKSCTNCGFQSQLDPRYKNIPFAGKDVASSGCAPAVATMVSATMGGNMDMSSAINKARAYTNSNGTSARYFEDTFNASPIKSTSNVKTTLENGNPVILLGRDPSNHSKDKSPFGPDNHYVLATGLRNGKVLINDPESTEPKVYNQSILNKSSYNLGYGGSSNKRGKGEFKHDKNSEQVWAYLTQKLGFSEAGAAGLMGCWAEESSINPDTVEGFWLPGFPGADAGNTPGGFDDYTKNILWPANKKKINKPAYYGNDGHLYPGLGLAQWTGPRGEAIINYAKSKNKKWQSLELQMDYITNELKGSKANYYEKAKTASDVNQAAIDAYQIFEGGDMSYTDWINTRKKHAANIYSTFTGKTYSWEGGEGEDADVSSNGVSSSDAAASSSDGGILSILSNIFGSLGNIFDIKNGFNLNSSSSNNNSSSSDGTVTNAKGAEAAAQAAENEIGYHEEGVNITKFGDWAGCPGDKWCAAFAAWAIAQAFDKQKSSAVKAIYDCPNVNYCPTLEATYKGANKWFDEPEVGDEVIYSNGSVATHTGIVTSVDKNAKTFESTEGNSNDQVRKITHTSYKDGPANHHVIGFGRPDYTGANATVTSNDNDKNQGSMTTDSGYSAAGSGLMRRGGSSGLLRQAAPSRFAYGSFKGQRFKYGGSSGLISKNRFSGAGSNLTKTVTKTLTNLKKNLTGGINNNGYSNSGTIDAELVESLLVSITQLLNSINSNTAPTQQIYNALKEYIDYVKGNKTTTSTNQVSMPTNNNEVDTNFANLVTTLAAIARG